MGCPSEVIIGENLTFSVCTHAPGTSILTDADAVPDYWIYEDETGVSINANTPLADVMAKLDDAHTTGFYTETIACTAGNGFEAGKTYTIYIEATVGGVKGGVSYGFKAVSNIVEGAITEKQALQALLAFAAGKAAGGGTATLTFRDQADSKDRITMTVDANGNRSVVTPSFD